MTFFEKQLEYHRMMSQSLSNAVNRYCGFVQDVDVLEQHLEMQHEATQSAVEHLDKWLSQAREQIGTAILNGKGNLGGSQLLAASPAFAGPGTRPYRIVLLKLANDQFSVHRMYFDSIGGFDDGSYFKENNYQSALLKWIGRTEYEIANRDSRCYSFIPLP